jgi:arginyl-tRNA synthetase
MIRQKIIKLIEKATGQKDIHLERPENQKYGDYSTNIALKLKRNPREIVEKLNSSLFEKIEIAGPGFINFFLSKEYLQKQIRVILKEKEEFGKLNIGRNKKIQVEFISANPTGPLTIGNARGGPFGDVLGNVLKRAGFKVEKAYYINDYGMQILALGHSVLKDNQAQYKGDYIDYLNKKIKETDAYKAGEKAAKIIIEEMIKKTVERMGIKYDEWFSEKELHKKSEVDKVLNFLERKGLIYEKEGAKWFKATRYGDRRDRVIVKADGWKTYLAGDIAYHRYKFEKKKFDKVINIWGADHAGDVAGLLAALEALGHKNKLDIILLQFVTLFEKKEKIKMSKRKGIYLTMDELLDKIPLDVIRFFFLQKSADNHLNFDLDLAREQSEKNPVYYVQYAFARICSILRKGKKQELKIKVMTRNLKLLNHLSELNLIKQLIRLPEVIEDTAKDYQVQRIPQYSLDLATAFHQFYRDCRVLSEDKNLTQARLNLVLATKIVLKNTLDLMGISAPEKM